MAKKGKRAPSPVAAAKRAPQRLAGVAHDGEGEHHPVWRLFLLDHEYDGDWHWRVDAPTTLKIVNFMQEMERLTWRQIWDQQAGGQNRGAKHKFIPVGSLCKDAQARLTELQLDEWDQLFRFRVGWSERLWGILTDESPRVFYPIWWDPQHKICT